MNSLTPADAVMMPVGFLIHPKEALVQRSCGSNPAEQQHTMAQRLEKIQKTRPKNSGKNCLTLLLDS